MKHMPLVPLSSIFRRVAPWFHAGVLVTLLWPVSALATVVIAETWAEMAHSSALVVRGRVAQMQAKHDEASGRTSTYVDFEVIEMLKGQSRVKLRLKEPGGKVGSLRQDIVGSARFTAGQDMLLFLEPADEPGTWLVRSMAAGKVDFEKAATGEIRAKRHFEGLSFFDRKNSLEPIQSRGDEDLGPVDAFLAQIRLSLRSR